MEAQWNGRKDVAATDMTDFERDEAKCSIDFCRLRGGLIWSLQVGQIEQSFAYHFRPFKICFDQLPAISPELVNELRILQPCQSNFSARTLKPSWPGPEHAESRIPFPLQSSHDRKAAGSFGIGPL
jgi:hypothetical protein